MIDVLTLFAAYIIGFVAFYPLVIKDVKHSGTLKARIILFVFWVFWPVVSLVYAIYTFGWCLGGIIEDVCSNKKGPTP